jgi:hypothetical protein
VLSTDLIQGMLLIATACLSSFSDLIPRPVPASLPKDVACLALETASILQAAGLPSMAVEALHVASKLLMHMRPSDRNQSVEVVADPLGRFCEYLLAASWAPAASANQMDDSGERKSDDHESIQMPASSSTSTDIASVEQRLSKLKAAGLEFNFPTVQALIQKHVQCTAPADNQLLLPPLKLRRLWTSRDSSASLLHPPSGGNPPAQQRLGEDADAPSAFALYQAAHGGFLSPRSSLAVSRTSRDSVTFGGSSPPAAGSRGPHSPSAAPSTGLQLPGSGLLPSRSSSGLSAASVAASLQHHDVTHLSAHHAHQGSLFEEPLDVINIEGDKCRAAASSGLVTPDGHGRPFAVVTGAKHELQVVERCLYSTLAVRWVMTHSLSYLFILWL